MKRADIPRIVPVLIAAAALLPACKPTAPEAAPTTTGLPTTAPPPAATATRTLELTPTSSPTPPESDAEGHYAAMRPGYEGDVDAHAGKTRYWLDVTLSDDPSHIEGTQRVRYHNASASAPDEVVFRLYPNALAGEPLLRVASVTVDGQAVEAGLSVGDSVLRVPLEEPLPPGESVEIEMCFVFDLPPDAEIAYGRMSWLEGVATAPSFFPVLSVYEEGSWWAGRTDPQGDPGYSEVALFDVTLTAPGDLTVASSGTILDAAPQPDGTTVYHIATGPVRDFALAFSRDFEVLSETRDGVTVNAWAMPSAGEDAAWYILEVTFQTLDIFNEQFGEYPFNELDIVAAPVSALGIEYPGLIYLSSRIWGGPGDALLETVLVHEIAHQWWYSMVGNNQVEEPWLDEGLAEYSVQVYYRELRGPAAGRFVRDSYRSELETYLEEGHPRRPVGLPVDEYRSQEYRVFVYSAGALFYSHLSDEYGPERTRDLLRVYYAQYGYRVAHSDDMLRLVREVFGPDAADFFAEWVYGG
jgi:hypothetical protein